MKSRMTHGNGPFLGLVLATFGLLVSFACQSAQLVEYQKLENDSQVPRISQEDAKKDYDAGTAVFVDSRAEANYNQEHITGALSIPIGSTEDKFSVLPKNKKIIVYCS